MNYYSFPAIKGHQGLHEYYLIQCHPYLLARIFLFDDAEVPANLRRVQTIDTSKVVLWEEYISTRRDDYTLSPLVAVVDQTIVFESITPEIPELGRVQIPMKARLIIRDGQHRRAAIRSLVNQSVNLDADTISIMLIPDPELARAAQIYVDLHPNYGRTTRSKQVLQDHSDLATLVRQLVDEIPLFQGVTELEKTTISNRSTALFTLSAIYQATQALLGASDKDVINIEQTKIAYDFWQALGQIIPEWQRIINRETTAANLRQKYIHAHTVTLLALGMVGHDLITAHPADWQERIKLLGTINWSRDYATLWEGRAMVRGKMNKSRDSITLTVSAIKQMLGLPLTERELVLEQHFNNL